MDRKLLLNSSVDRKLLPICNSVDRSLHTHHPALFYSVSNGALTKKSVPRESSNDLLRAHNME